MSLFSQISGLQFELTEGDREDVRKSLYDIFGDESLLDLDMVPESTSPYISISHTDGCSGWVSHSKPVGFDIEKSDRPVNEKTLLRVSEDMELNSAPSPLALWVAKEAAFKSLRRSDQPAVLSQIRVTEWECLKSNLYRYKFSNINDLDKSFEGWVETGERFTLGIALGEA